MSSGSEDDNSSDSSFWSGSEMGDSFGSDSEGDAVNDPAPREYVKHIPAFDDDEYYASLGCSSDLEEGENEGFLSELLEEDRYEKVQFRHYRGYLDDDDDDDDEETSESASEENVWCKEEFAEKEMYKTSSPDHDTPTTSSREIIDYFHAYLPPNLWKEAVDHTNKYIKENMKNARPVSYEELMIYLALNIATGLFQIGALSAYWCTDFGVKMFKDNMSHARFLEIRKALHFADTKAESNDRLYKVRPLYDRLRQRCISLKRDNNVCIDELMVPFDGWIDVERYFMGESKPWGIKMFIMANKNGQILDFILYQGDTTEYSQEDVEVYGTPGATVLHLIRSLEPEKYNLFSDEYFLSYKLVEELTKKKFNCAGTIRPKRFKNPPLESDKALIRKGIGSADQLTNKDKTFGIIKWVNPEKDVVTVISNCVLNGTQQTVSKSTRKKNKGVECKMPEIIGLCATNMRGVDIIDQHINDFRILYKSGKWTVQLIGNAVDLAVALGYLEYKEEHPSGMKLRDFRKKLFQNIIHQMNFAKRLGKVNKNLTFPTRRSARKLGTGTSEKGEGKRRRRR